MRTVFAAKIVVGICGPADASDMQAETQAARAATVLKQVAGKLNYSLPLTRLKPGLFMSVCYPKVQTLLRNGWK